MKKMNFTQAIDHALGQAMREDSSIILLGEDTRMIRRDLLTRFGPERVLNTPISENAFIGAAIAASMAGLRPVVEVYMADFLGVAMDQLLNFASKVKDFSGGKWDAPVVIRVPCGGGYGDGGQHEQSLWGWIAHIPGLSVVVPSIPEDAGRLMYSALQSEGPVLFFEHKLLSEVWLEFLGSGGRKTVSYDIPEEGRRGEVPGKWGLLPFGEAAVRKNGSDVTIVSLGVGVHRALKASIKLESEGINAEVIDLRTLAPLDKKTVCESVAKTGSLIVVDEDYENFGLSGELAAVVLESGTKFNFGRVCTKTTIPYSRKLEDETLPNVKRIKEEVVRVLS
ncbi:MAG: transketolase C-terminal domain-containing protein [Acidobacteriota bacterium]